MKYAQSSRAALAERAPAVTLKLAACDVAVVPLQAAPHDPIPALYDEWKRTSAEWNAAIGSADESDLKVKVRDLEERICTAVPTTREGMITQLQYAMDDLGIYMFGNLRKNLDRELFENLLNGLKAVK